MLIGFELRPGDFRAFEQWLALKGRSLRKWTRTLYYAAVAIGFLLCYLSPVPFGLRADSSLLALPLAVGVPILLVSLIVGHAIASRFRLAAPVVEGAHSLHFSRAGIHHVGPTLTARYEWAHLGGVEVTLSYLFIRFKQGGVVPIPVSALKPFGDAYDEAFLMQLKPLIQAGRS